jgi:hypothetical protein
MTRAKDYMLGLKTPPTAYNVVQEVSLRVAEDHEILESVFVEMDPTLYGFVGIFVDLCRKGEEFVFTETAAGTGNRLLTFSSRKRELAYRVLRQELGAYLPREASITRDDLP